ncbi:MAG: hypothetical protein ABIU54_11420, partial [Candidatus Eisenbacteria bacterium]
MRDFLRLLTFLRPYRARLAMGIACMVLYALTNTVAISLVQPLMGVMFSSVGAPQVAPATSGPSKSGASPVAPSGAAGAILGQVRMMQHDFEQALLRVPPLKRFERVSLAILVLFLFKNLADYAASFLSVSV